MYFGNSPDQNLQGAAGHMCGQFFDIQGQFLDIEINRRAVGIGIKTLTNMPLVIAVAGGAARGRRSWVRGAASISTCW